MISEASSHWEGVVTENKQFMRANVRVLASWPGPFWVLFPPKLR